MARQFQLPKRLSKSFWLALGLQKKLTNADTVLEKSGLWPPHYTTKPHSPQIYIKPGTNEETHGKIIYFLLKFRSTFQDRKGSSLYLCFALLTINNFSWDDFGGRLDRGPYSFWLCNNHFCDGSCGSDDSRFCSCWHCLNSFLPLQRSQSLQVNLMELFS